MAKAKGKVEKLDEGEDEGEPFKVAKVREDDSVDVEEAAPENKATPRMESVRPAERPKGWVEFNCFEDVDPSPTIGKFDFTRELSVTRLESRAKYVIPRDVAEVLVDRKKGTITPGS